MRSNQDDWEVEDIVHEEMSDNNKNECESIIENAIETETPVSSKKKKKSKKNILLQRSEASLNVSEFNLSEGGKEKVNLNDLVKTSLKVTGQVNQKNLLSIKKLKKLNVPLNKKRQEKIKRTIAYEKICDEVKKWDKLVQSNRSADQLVFPLKKPDFQMHTLDSTVENFITKHPVEIAVSELLEKSENRLEPKKSLTIAEEKALKAMSAAEAKLRHAELMKYRALISYQEAKARHQNRIKSKRYHRLLKKEKLKKFMREFETLQKNDAAQALEKFEELDKLRVLERMTLKHRNTGKWAKQQKIRAKYNPDSKSTLKEDLEIGRQLREKIDRPKNVEQTFHSSTEACADIDNDFRLIEEPFTKETNKLSSDFNFTDNASSEVGGEKTLLSEIYEKLSTAEKPKPKQSSVKSVSRKKDTVDDIMEFASKEQCLDSAVPDGLSLGNEDFDEVMGDIMPMSEAFGNEDCIPEFRAEKEAVEEASRPKGIDLFLPGWGSWGGPGIKPSNNKRKRFFIKAPPIPKKNTLGNVIINEDKDKKASIHQVNNLPFPFTNVRQFESYIRQPVGHTWNPQSSFQNLIAPKVITKMGKIIEPIDADDLALKSENKIPQKRKKKKGSQSIKAF